jgi:hypothetical protein
MSYREDAAAIISIAQQANPNVMGHSEPLRAQFATFSRDSVMMPKSPSFTGGPIWINPIEHQCHGRREKGEGRSKE